MAKTASHQQKFSSKNTIRSQYFIYFGVMGMVLPYFNLYCYHIGFSGLEIGVLSAVRSVVVILFSLVWGLLADRHQARRPIYIACSFLSAAAWALFFTTIDFWPMLLITVVYGVFYAPIISFLEAFTMDILGSKRQSYGKTRAWGSISFIAVVIVLGRLIDATAITVILPLVLAGSLLQALFATRIPRIHHTITSANRMDVRRLGNRRAVVFLVCAFLMLVSHGAYYGFFSIHLENLGYDKTFIGLAWALASSAEILVMIASERIFKRFSLENVLLFSFAAAVVRWSLLYAVVSPVAILGTQILHAATYGTFHMASILYMDRLMPAASKTIGQAVNNAVTYGLGLMVGFFLSGYLYGHMGSAALFALSAGIAVIGGLGAALLRKPTTGPAHTKF